MPGDPFQGLGLAGDDAFELGLAHGIKEGFELGAGVQTEAFLQVVARDEGRGVDRSLGLAAEVPLAVVNLRGIAGRGERIRPVKREEILNSGGGENSLEPRLS